VAHLSLTLQEVVEESEMVEEMASEHLGLVVMEADGKAMEHQLLPIVAVVVEALEGLNLQALHLAEALVVLV
jgi:hypothetical protein